MHYKSAIGYPPTAAFANASVEKRSAACVIRSHHGNTQIRGNFTQRCKRFPQSCAALLVSTVVANVKSVRVSLKRF
jgi:hypothetical protein